MLADENYADIRGNEDLVASEVKSRLSGPEGERLLKDLVREADEAHDPIEKAQRMALVARIKALLTEMWDETKRWFAESNVFTDTYTREQIMSMRAEDFVRKTLRDLAEGVNPTEYGMGEAVQYSKVTDKSRIDWFDKQPKIRTYKTIAVDKDGNMGAPMANSISTTSSTKRKVKMGNYEFGDLYEADEHPELVDDKGKITIIRDDGKSLKVAYDPYDHSSDSYINDQFKSAWERDNLIVIEQEVAQADLDEHYHADLAYLPTGMHEWKKGVVGRQLPEDEARHVYLARWSRPTGQVSWDKVAEEWIEKTLKNGIDVPFNVVPKAIRDRLADAGVNIIEPEKGMGQNCFDAYEEWKAERRKNQPVEKRRMDNQGNPIDENGKFVLEETGIDDLTEEDFFTPTRNVVLPKLPKRVSDVIGASNKPIIIKKNVFAKNHKFHPDLSAQDSRNILYECLYNTDRYGQNRKKQRPYNWILIHLNDNQSAVVVEVNPTKDNLEIVNWHWLRNKSLEQKENQAFNEGGLILTLPKDNAAGNTAEESLDSVAKVNNETETANVSGGKVQPSGEILDETAQAAQAVSVPEGATESDEQAARKPYTRPETMRYKANLSDDICAGATPAPTPNPGETATSFMQRLRDWRTRSISGRANARDNYERRIRQSSYQVREALQDSMLSLRAFTDSVLQSLGKAKGDIKDYMNAYLAENQLSSKNKAASKRGQTSSLSLPGGSRLGNAKAEQDEYRRKLMKPLVSEIDALQQEGASREETTRSGHSTTGVPWRRREARSQPRSADAPGRRTTA